MIGNLIFFVVIGIIAGWIVGKLLKGSGFGLTGNLIIGAIGSIVGGMLAYVIGLSTNSPVIALGTAVAGALIFLAIAAKLKKSRHV